MDVKTAARTIAIFESFAHARKPLTLAELSRILECPSSSCLYLVRTLESLGYIYPSGGRKAFYPTRKMLDVSKLIADAEPWLDRFIPLLEQLRDETDETIILGKRQADHVIYLAVCEGSQTIRYSARAGDIKPLHSSAIGKALLSTLPAAQQAETVKRLKLAEVTPATITDRAALIAQLEEIARRGYSESRGENVADVMAIAKPVRLNTDIYAIAVAGPIGRMTGRWAVHLERLNAACHAIEAMS